MDRSPEPLGAENFRSGMQAFRSKLAYQVIASHGLAMFTLFAAPLQFFLMLLAKENLGAALLAAGLMVTMFIATLRLAPPFLAVSPRTPSRKRPGLLRAFRVLVGNGDAIQAMARRIDPQWRNPYAGRSPHETSRWLTSMELMHWATLAASVPPIVAAFWSGHHAFGMIYVAANALYNVIPNMVIRNTRRRLLAVMSRSAADSRAC